MKPKSLVDAAQLQRAAEQMLTVGPRGKTMAEREAEARARAREVRAEEDRLVRLHCAKGATDKELGAVLHMTPAGAKYRRECLGLPQNRGVRGNPKFTKGKHR